MGPEIVLIVFLSLVVVYVFGWVIHVAITRGRMSPFTTA